MAGAHTARLGPQALPNSGSEPLRASQGLLSGCLTEGQPGSQLGAGRTRTVLSPARVSSGPGSGRGRRWPEKETVEICSQGRKWTNCGGGVGMPAGMPPPWCPPPPGDLGPESGSAWCLGRRSSGCLGVGARPAPPPVPARGCPGGGLGADGAAGWGDRFLSAPSAPPAPLAPDAGTCHTRPHALLHLEGSSPGEDCSAFRTQLWPSSWTELSLKSPSPRMPCPSVPLLQFHRTDPLPCTRAAHTLLCILHRTVAATCRSAGWSIQLAPVCTGPGGEHLWLQLPERTALGSERVFSFLGPGRLFNHRGPLSPSVTCICAA